MAIASSSALYACQRVRVGKMRDGRFLFHRGRPRLLSSNFHHVGGHYPRAYQRRLVRVPVPPKHKYAMVKGATRKETQHLRKEFERRNAAQIQPYPLEERRGAFNPLAGHEVQPKLVRLTDVQPEEVVWLWKDRIPCGKLTLLEGDPDDGKSTVAYDVAARVSAGRAMPLDNTPRDPAGVIILSAEDGLADTIRPRLEAADADLDRATSAQVVYGRQHGTLS